MQFFIDTADIEEIRRARQMGLVDGVTTNPSLLAKACGPGQDWRDRAAEIVALVDGPVSLEVFATGAEAMLQEARGLVQLGPNVVVKIPATEQGIIAVRELAQAGIRTNVTLVFSPLQALLAAKAGAAFVSPFVGRLDDIGHRGMQLVEEILTVYRQYAFSTQIIVASIRSPEHVREAALMGAHISTIPFKVLVGLLRHPLTEQGLARFAQDAAKLS